MTTRGQESINVRFGETDGSPTKADSVMRQLARFDKLIDARNADIQPLGSFGNGQEFGHEYAPVIGSLFVKSVDK